MSVIDLSLLLEQASLLKNFCVPSMSSDYPTGQSTGEYFKLYDLVKLKDGFQPRDNKHTVGIVLKIHSPLTETENQRQDELLDVKFFPADRSPDYVFKKSGKPYNDLWKAAKYTRVDQPTDLPAGDVSKDYDYYNETAIGLKADAEAKNKRAEELAAKRAVKLAVEKADAEAKVDKAKKKAMKKADKAEKAVKKAYALMKKQDEDSGVQVGKPCTMRLEDIMDKAYETLMVAQNAIDYDSGSEEVASPQKEETMTTKKTMTTKTTKTGVKIMQWNQKWLGKSTQVEKYDQVGQLCKTIMYDYPAVVIFEEVQPHKDGIRREESIVAQLTDMLNHESAKSPRCEENAWEYILSEQVGYDEQYCCFYRPKVVGQIEDSCLLEGEDDTCEVKKLLPRGFKPAFVGGRRSQADDAVERIAYNSISIGPNKVVDMSDFVCDVYDKYVDNCETHKYFDSQFGDVSKGVLHPKELNARKKRGLASDASHGFDYNPVLFSFTGADAGTFHIVAVHGSTGLKSYGKKKTVKVPEQNLLEMTFLQTLCTAATSGEDPQFVVLLGDFNTQEPANMHMGLWDNAGNLPCNTNNVPFCDREPGILRPVRDAFLQQYARAVPPHIPTNVFPFLAGVVSEPRHNDDIWVPRSPAFSNWSFEESSGRVVKIPPHVLRTWDNVTNAFFESEFENGNIYCALKGSAKVKFEKDDDGDDDGDDDDDDDERKPVKEKKPDATSRGKLNAALAQVWSDHRPVIATIKYSSTSTSVTNE
jgi:hypothetical protein